MYCIESVISVIDKKNNETIIDKVTFDINAKHKTMNDRMLLVGIQCIDSRLNESVDKPIQEAFRVLGHIFMSSLPGVKQISTP